MKKTIRFMAMCLALAALVLASCEKTDDGPTPPPLPTANSLFVVSNGVQSTSQPGSLTVFDFETLTAAQNAFQSKNGITLGDTPQSALYYCGRLYITVTDSNLIWVLDARILEVIARIVPEAGTMAPRCMVAHQGKVYVSLFSGHVARIDVATNAIDKTFAVGPNPEQLAVAGNYLYVANSDGYNWGNNYADGYLSKIDLNTFAEEKIQVGTNPNAVVTDALANRVYVLTMGNYGDIPAEVKYLENGTVTTLCPGTIMGAGGGKLYVINDPIGGSGATYRVYGFTSGQDLGEMVNIAPESPVAVVVDKIQGKFVILSRCLDSAGYPMYTEPGKAYLYDQAGTLLSDFPTGINPTGAAFGYDGE